MFKIQYRICDLGREEEGYGVDGFIKLIVNDKFYGEIYPEQLDDIMSSQSLLTWFDFLSTAAVTLLDKNYVAVSDVESTHIWIEFVKKDTFLYIGIVSMPKPDGNLGILTAPLGRLQNAEFWCDEKITYMEFAQGVVCACNQYITELKRSKSRLLLNCKDEIDQINENLNRISHQIGESIRSVPNLGLGR